MDHPQPTHTLSLQERLEPVLSYLERLDVILAVTDENRVHGGGQDPILEQNKLQVVELLKDLSPGEVAHLLEMLPLPLRNFVWELLDDQVSAEVIVEVQPSLSEDLLTNTPVDKLPALLDELEPENLAEFKDHIEDEQVVQSISQAIERLPDIEQAWVQLQLNYEDGQIGGAMVMDRLVIHETATVSQTIAMIQSMDELPDQTDKVFICDRSQRLLGEVPLLDLLRRRADEPITQLMSEQQISFLDTDPIEEAIQAFDLHDLISAPVVDSHHCLLGRLTIETISDIERKQAEEQSLARDGLRPDHDLFGPTLKSARHRWSWLALNLFTAFIASGCIHIFEGAITHLVTLATLMPIVASLGGNAGNQTIALFIRGLGTRQINDSNLRYLATKEVTINTINGVIWGSLLGLIGYFLYGKLGLALVLAIATSLNLIMASILGILVPLGLNRLGRDPAMGSSVILTFCTDSLGFFIFLGLAATFLI